MEAIRRIIHDKEKSGQPAEEAGKFFSVLVGEVGQEDFLELKFKDGQRACFAYDDLLWFNWHPESGALDLEFGGYLVTVKGRGLYPKLFNGVKTKRVGWIKEADLDLQDHDGADSYVEEILIAPPSGGAKDNADS